MRLGVRGDIGVVHGKLSRKGRQIIVSLEVTCLDKTIEMALSVLNWSHRHLALNYRWASPELQARETWSPGTRMLRHDPRIEPPDISPATQKPFFRVENMIY